MTIYTFFRSPVKKCPEVYELQIKVSRFCGFCHIGKDSFL